MPIISLDTETYGEEALNWLKGQLLGYSISHGERASLFDFHDAPVGQGWPETLANQEFDKVFHNAKYDMHYFARYGMPVAGKIYDTYFLARLLDENLPTYKLKPLAVRYLGEEAAAEAENLDQWLEENGLKKSDLDKAPRELVSKYGAKDAEITLQLYTYLREALTKEEIPDSLIDLECFVLRIAYEMEHQGVHIDRAFLESYREKLQAEQAASYQRLQGIAGKEFNPRSGAEVREIMQALGWKPDTEKRKEKKNQEEDSVDKEALKNFDHPFSKEMLEYRRISTVLQTFVIGILEKEVNGKVHCSYNTAGADTGRWSSSGPNLQNVDKKSEARKAFVPKPGHAFWFFDYKQIEPCIFAHFVNSKRLNEAFQQGLDFHTFNASMAYRVDIAQVTPQQRGVAKNLGLALMYQAGKAKAAKMMGLPFAEGVRIFDGFHKNMPEVKAFTKKINDVLLDRAKKVAMATGRLKYEKGAWVYDEKPIMDKYVNKVNTKKNVVLEPGKKPENPGDWWGPFQNWEVMEERGWLKDPFGRKHRLLMSESYKGLNRLVQGTAANVLKIGMARAVKETGIYPLLQVHDELVFELPVGEKAVETVKIIKERMESVQEFFPNIPIRVDVAMSTTNWAEEQEIVL